MSELIGTVHKPQQPEVPEPEGWAFMYRPIDSEGTWPWRFGMTELRGRKWAESRALDFARDRELVRLVHIGPAPKVPVVTDVDLVCDHAENDLEATDYSCSDEDKQVARDVREAIARLRSWLSDQEEGDK